MDAAADVTSRMTMAYESSRPTPAPAAQQEAFTRAMAHAGAPHVPPVAPPTPDRALTRSLFDPSIDAMLRLDEQAVTAFLQPAAAPPVRAAESAGRNGEALQKPETASLPERTDACLEQGTGASAADFSLEATAASSAVSLPPTSGRAADFNGLHLGQRDSAGNGPVSRLQKALHQWNPRLERGQSGCYDETTAKAVLLLKSIYATGHDGRRVDPRTADLIARLEDGSFQRNPPVKSFAGRLIEAASEQLGTPYRLGGDGVSSTDCGMLTREALRRAGLADASFSRLADTQYRYAETGKHGLQLTHQPQAGDLVFFNHPTHQSAGAYHGITHVGVYLSDGYMLAASSARGRVVVQELGRLSAHVSGYGRPSPSAALVGQR